MTYSKLVCAYFILFFLPLRPASGAQSQVDLLRYMTKQAETSRHSAPAEEFREGVRLLGEQKYLEAEANFKKVAQTTPGFAPAFLGLAEIRMENEDPAAARAYFEKAVNLAPGDPVIQTDWGHYLFFRKRYGEAKLAFAKAIALNPKAARPHYELGDLYLLGFHDPAKAAAAYRDALAIEPNNSRVHYTLANALAEAGKLDAAQSEMQNAVRLAPRNLALLKAFGDFELRRGHLDEAEKTYGRALALDPRYLPARIASGDARVARNDLDGAIAEYDAALQIAPRATDPLVKIAILREKQGRWREAEQFYRKALNANPTLGPASNELAWLLVQHAQDTGEAVELATRTVARYPRNAEFKDTLAWALRANKQPGRALIAAQTAAALDSKDPVILYHLGVLYQETGKPTLAASAYARALAITKPFDGAKDAQTRLAALKGHN